MFDKNLLNLPVGKFDYNSYQIPERKVIEDKITYDLTHDAVNEEKLNEVQRLISRTPIDSLLIDELPLSGLNFSIKKVQTLGAYFPGTQEIVYYGKNNHERIVQIHERYHAIQHLTPDPKTNAIWKNFTLVDYSYTELLAQLFTYKYIIDFEPWLENDFLALNINQSATYQSWKYFSLLSTSDIINLYWKIRKASAKPGNLKMFNSFQRQVNPLQLEINNQLLNSLIYICKNPSVFFSEADVHHLIMQKLMTIEALDPTLTLYPTNCTIGKTRKVPIGKTQKAVSDVKYETMLMHREYGIKGSPKSRYDLVILNQSDIAKIDDPINLKHNSNWLNPDYIFEFGTEKSASGVDYFRNHLIGDLKKAEMAHIQGYVIHIQRNYQKSPGARHVKNIDKYKEYETEFKIAFQAFKLSPTGIMPRIIFILINFGVEKRSVRGKIKILKNPLTPNCKLTFVGLDKLEAAIAPLLF